MKSRRQNRLPDRRSLPLILSATALAAALALFALTIHASRFDPAKIAAGILRGCTNDSHPDTCYAEQFAGISKTRTLPQTLQVLEAFQRSDDAPAGCHFIGHVIAYQAVAKDPPAWESVRRQIQPDTCSGGLLMGLLEARKKFEPGFKLDTDTIHTTCEADALTCIHTMGHLALIEADGDVGETLEICESLASHLHHECMAGTFMENFYRRNLEVHRVSKPVKWDAAYLAAQQDFCNSYGASPAKACWREVSHVIVNVADSKPQDIWDACRKAPDDESRDACYLHAVGILSLAGKQTDKSAADLCSPVAGLESLPQRCRSVVSNNVTSRDLP